MFNIINVIHFLKEKNSSSSSIDYESLAMLYNKYDSPLIRDCILLTLYDYIKEISMPFGYFIENKDVIGFLNNYSETKNLFVTHKDDIEKLESFLFYGNESILNKKELIPYLVIESLLDYERSNNFFVQSISPSKLNYSTQTYTDIIDIDETKSFIDNFSDKMFGFYICKTQSQKNSRMYYGYTYNIVSHQPDGLYFYELYSKYTSHHGFRQPSLEVRDNMIIKPHSIEIKVSEENKSLSVHSHRGGIKNTINQLIYRTFTYWCELYKDSVDKTGVIGSFPNKTGNSLTNYPAISSYKSKEIKAPTFENLKFSDKYECLKFLDDKFENILDMDLVNFTSTELDFITTFEHTNGNSPSDLKKDYDFTPEFFNNLNIEKIYMPDALATGKVSGFSFSSINPHFQGTEEQLDNHVFRTAKINKMRLYAFYINLYMDNQKHELADEMQAFFKENSIALLSDPEFLSTINKVGTSNISDRNLKTELRDNGKAFFILNDDDAFFEKDYLYKRLKPCKDVNFRDYKGKSKAQKFIAFDCNNLDMINVLKDKYKLKLSDNSEFCLKLVESFHILKNIIVSDKITKTDSIIYALDLDIDVELYTWNAYNTLFYCIIPMSKKHHEEFLLSLESQESTTEVLNCNFGYSNGSRSFY